jgi:hypothetical protein
LASVARKQDDRALDEARHHPAMLSKARCQYSTRGEAWRHRAKHGGGHHISSEIAQARIATAGAPAMGRLRPLASLQARTRKTMFASMLENRKTGMPTRPLSTIALGRAGLNSWKLPSKRARPVGIFQEIVVRPSGKWYYGASVTHACKPPQTAPWCYSARRLTPIGYQAKHIQYSRG